MTRRAHPRQPSENDDFRQNFERQVRPSVYSLLELYILPMRTWCTHFDEQMQGGVRSTLLNLREIEEDTGAGIFQIQIVMMMAGCNYNYNLHVCDMYQLTY